MTSTERTDGRLRTYAAPRHTDGLWQALALAVRDTDDDPVDSRRRLAALRLDHVFASAGDLAHHAR